MNTVRAIGGILGEGRYAGRAVSGDDFLLHLAGIYP
jgi:hypothetical protein